MIAATSIAIEQSRRLHHPVFHWSDRRNLLQQNRVSSNIAGPDRSSDYSPLASLQDSRAFEVHFCTYARLPPYSLKQALVRAASDTQAS